MGRRSWSDEIADTEEAWYDGQEPDHEAIDDGSEAEADDHREVVAAASGWGLSIVLHALVLLILGLIVVAGRLMDDPPPVRQAVIEPPPPPPEPETQLRELQQVEVAVEAEVTVESPVVHELEVEVAEIATEDPEVSEVSEAKGRAEAVSSSEAGGSGAFMAIGAGGGAAGAFGNRSGGAKKRAIGRFGGSRASESAVDAALRWFVRHQSPNGMWDVDGYPQNCTLPGPKCEPGENQAGEEDAAMTGYAVLAFLGAGYDHRTPNRYRKTVQGGLDWLVANQKPDGSYDRNYENGICAMALAEAYAMTMDPNLRLPAQKAIDYLLSVQNGQGNGYGGLGWDYTKPKTRNDSSVSGWVVMALKSAKAAGLDVGDGMTGSKRWFEETWRAANNAGQGIDDPYEDRSVFPYTWDSASGQVAKLNRTAIGLCVGVFLDRGAGDLMMETMANDVMARAFDERTPDYQVETYPVNTYYLYYNTLGIFQVGGERWKRWNATARDMLVNSQRRDGDCFDGSWDFAGTRFHGHDTGRILSTAYCVLSLQVYYRYLPVGMGR